MDKQKSLEDKFSKLFNNIASISKQLSDAVEEGLKETFSLVCVKNGLLDFELIEEDVKQIHEAMKSRGDKILRSHLILDNELDLMEIQTYTERGDKTFVNTIDAKVKRVTNIPSEILEELQKEGRVELSLKF
ncbi:hypothetical protein PN480_11915 [Dolichospermum circinale CS-1225]|uniref:hypothetical protein n=1 Tax=Dolichospermum circinale TaxID=109265 RepID=UPI00232E86A2|nr:hypothetical protein [Dolichospermum circinale]MDB9465296.1 hypothetical protein [Dolichospermum circinale CS-539/09]MDB9471138.1 hypothetical protein [Dolichospermum circinale CS-539]MDB9522651.1 hypothetical protein [Dolichospermum circinale CS-1225]